MKECLKEYKECDVKEIAEKYIEGEPQVSIILVMTDSVIISTFYTVLSVSVFYYLSAQQYNAAYLHLPISFISAQNVLLRSSV